MPKRNKIQLGVGISLLAIGYALPFSSPASSVTMGQKAVSLIVMMSWPLGIFLIIASTVYPKR